MTKTLSQLCLPRESVSETSRPDTVLSIKDLIEDRIDPAEFFSENYVTEGMNTLLTQGFARLAGRSAQGVFLLKQAMGGGKTHNLITFGLLAKHPQLCEQIAPALARDAAAASAVRVVAFNGRESSTPLGLWGAIAEQLGKKEFFKDLYSPLQAPGQTAWENLLSGERVLILIDELPPYLFNANTIAIGSGNLAEATTTALSNLLVAINSPACANVCLVITDLNASYDIETQRISRVLGILTSETNRSAQPLEPVNMGSDELYHILRKRLFKSLPDDAQIAEVAEAYRQAIHNARQMNLTDQDPASFAARVRASYPFHPAIRDLYARFKENPGFQQTRGLIRLMRCAVAHLYRDSLAQKAYLVAPHDLDFGDTPTRTEILQINNTLSNAIAHDISSDGGNSVAEQLDQKLNSRDASDVCRLIFMSSLANVEHPVIGLTIAEIATNLAGPGRDLQHLTNTVISRLSTEAWYLHADHDGKLFFKNTENLIARLESLVGAYAPEQAIKELKERLGLLFKPEQKWAYQKLSVLPALDELDLTQDEVTLVVFEPRTGADYTEIRQFYRQQTYHNRVGFLTGNANTYGTLIESGKRLKAIRTVLEEYKTDRRPDNDPLMVDARNMQDKYTNNFYSAVRETFTTLLYPVDDNGPQLERAEVTMQFTANKYDGEAQVIDLLRIKGKFEPEVAGETFRKKVEQRLFGNLKILAWAEIRRRAAMNPRWQWHIPNALESLKAQALANGFWREYDGQVEKGPFPPPATAISIRQLLRDDVTGVCTLEIQPLHADSVYYEIGGLASTASRRLEGRTLQTGEFRVSFLAVDSSGAHETGPATTWQNKLSMQYKFYSGCGNYCCDLTAVPAGAVIRYSTDGSNPAVSGGTYAGTFGVPQSARFVLAIAELDGARSEQYRWEVPFTKKVKDDDNETQSDPNSVQPDLPAKWSRVHRLQDTQSSYAFLESAGKFHAQLSGVRVELLSLGGTADWVELNFEESMRFDVERVRQILTFLRDLHPSGSIILSAGQLHFNLGADLNNMVTDLKTILNPGEWTQ